MIKYFHVYSTSSLTFCSYGYRGRDCRTNVYLLPTGEIVYFIASVVILFNYEERTQRHYLGHTDCVKWWENNRMTVALLCGWLVRVDTCLSASLAIHPDKIRIATGQIAGVDKDGRVWTEKKNSSLLSYLILFYYLHMGKTGRYYKMFQIINE